MWEDNRDFVKAINGYLEITKDHFQDPAFLEDVWTRAVFVYLFIYLMTRIILLKIQKEIILDCVIFLKLFIAFYF